MKYTRRYSFTLAVLATLATALSALAPASADGSEAELKAINARAAEIAATLDDDYGARTAPREYWERFAKAPDAAAVIRNAENVLKTEPPKLPEELYKEFYKNGNRSNYQGAYARLEHRLTTLTLAEALENKGRFIDALNVELDRFCDLKSWVLPAHDKDAQIYDGNALYSDLGSTLAGANVALAINLHGDKLDPKVVEKAKNEVDRRILQPYEMAVGRVYDGMWLLQAAGKVLKTAKPGAGYEGMWWVRTTNNWNAVCHAGTIVAALNVVESKERRAFFIAGAEYFSENNFMRGFTNDGYCSEGMSYWNYGFGHYLYLSAAIRNATHGKVDLLRFPKVRAVLDFAPTLEIDKGNYAVFADCPINARPDALFVGYLSRLKGYGYTDFETQALGDKFRVGNLLSTATIGCDADVVYPETSEPTQIYDAPIQEPPQKYDAPIRTEFKDAGVVICRPAKDAKGKYFAIAFKGGSNGEMHNHNDVGTYSLLIGTNADAKTPDVYVSRDPGGETYTARTFSARRYEGELLNSFGHPVPRIAGKLQSPGGACRGVVLSKSFDDAEDGVTFDITSAYPDVKTLDKALRTFQYRRATGEDSGFVAITDVIEFKKNEKGAIETALITFETPEIKSIGRWLEIKIGGAVVKVHAFDSDSKALKLVAETAIVGEHDDSVRNKPTRVAIRVDGEVQNATITQLFEVQ